MNINPLGLIKRALVPVKAQPGHGVKDGPGGFLGGTQLICILNAQDEPAAVATA